MKRGKFLIEINNTITSLNIVLKTKLFFFRGQDESDTKDHGCFVLAVIMYFFFMASFFWMLVISFDVCRTLRVRAKSNYLNGHHKSAKLILIVDFGYHEIQK